MAIKVQYKIISPYGILLGVFKKGKNKGKRNIFYMNLNRYRNLHFLILNNAKVAYYELMKDTVLQLPKFKTVSLKYIVYASTKRKFDIMNICSIVDKFFCDVLVKTGRIKDDNYDVVTKIECVFGGIDPYQERIEIILTGEI